MPPPGPPDDKKKPPAPLPPPSAAVPTIPPLAKPPARPAAPAPLPSVPRITLPTLLRVPPAVSAPRPPAAAAPAPGLAAKDSAELQRLASTMDTLDYFELLHCDRAAPPAEIKRAFYQWSRTFHPDKFFQLRDKELKERVHDVYKRLTEAYYVLRDDTKRTKYVADITGPERAQKLRFTETSELETKVAKKKEIEEQVGTHPKGRQFFQTGMGDFDAGRWAAAERNFKMALTYEPQNPRYKEKLKEAGDKIFQESRERGDHFKIK
jgi:hypothetical protein